MGADGGCGCGTGALPCGCERPAPPARPAAPRPPDARPRGPEAAPGAPERYTRFDLSEEARRRGAPVAFPADPARPPPAAAPRSRPAVLEPAAHPAAGERAVVGPRFDAPAPRRPGDGPLAPDGAPLDIERFLDVASPEGVVMPFEAAWPGDLPATDAARAGAEPRRPPEPLQPPEYLGSIGGPEERALLDAPPPAEEPRAAPPPPPGPPGFASPDAPREGEPVAPGQEPCTEHAHFVFPPAEPHLFTPQPPEARGGGGAGEEEEAKLYAHGAVWIDPCPCECVCVGFAAVVNIFVEAGKLLRPFFDLFGRARGFLGASRTPVLVLSTPDGFVEHVRDLVARRDAVRYGTEATSAPGSAAPADGLTATSAGRARAASAPQRLLWPELDGTLAAEVRVAPVGPGPGIPGIGARPLVPADGTQLRAAPGSLFAGIASAADAFGPGMKGAR
jgi:hypothetical protein